jgi:hypothetical protein
MMVDFDGVIGAAVAQTGMDDFGDDSFREGLAILLASLRDEARLNARGEGYLYARIVTALSQRLQVEDWYRRHPEIDDVEIVAPLIGLGLPRTGSTALSVLLAQTRPFATCGAGNRRNRARRRRPWQLLIRGYRRRLHRSSRPRPPRPAQRRALVAGHATRIEVSRWGGR